MPAPYESPQQDDLSATIAAILTSTVGLITSWVLGQQAYPVVRQFIDGALGNLTTAQEDALEASLDTVAVPTVGWAVAAVLMAIGALLLLFRRGRGLLVLGALLVDRHHRLRAVRSGLRRRRTPRSRSASGRCSGAGWWSLVLALLPGTGRWLGKQRRVAKPSSTVIGTTESGAILWPVHADRRGRLRLSPS